MILKAHGIILDCNFKHPLYNKLIKNFKGQRKRDLFVKIVNQIVILHYIHHI